MSSDHLASCTQMWMPAQRGMHSSLKTLCSVGLRVSSFPFCRLQLGRGTRDSQREAGASKGSSKQQFCYNNSVVNGSFTNANLIATRGFQHNAFWLPSGWSKQIKYSGLSLNVIVPRTPFHLHVNYITTSDRYDRAPSEIWFADFLARWVVYTS